MTVDLVAGNNTDLWSELLPVSVDTTVSSGLYFSLAVLGTNFLTIFGF